MNAPTTSYLLTALSTETKATRSAIASSLQGGLKAAVYAGVLAYFARTAHAASREQISFLILGRDKVKDSDGGEAKVYRAAMRMAGVWQTKGLWTGMFGANSFDAATKAALDFLKLEGVRSIEGLGEYLMTGKASDKDAPTFSERVTSLLKSHSKVDAKKPLTAIDLEKAAAAIVNAVGLANARAFCEAAAATLNTIATAAAAAADATTREHMTEPTDAELLANVETPLMAASINPTIVEAFGQQVAAAQRAAA